VTRIIAAVLTVLAGSAPAADATFTVRTITPEAALKVAQAALERCRAEGFQVTVAVVDRGGVTQALIRDRFASPQSIDIAQGKARTAANFRMNTAALDRETQPGRPSVGLRNIPGVMPIAGGMVIESQGALVGAIGVSGAPGGANDDICAAAGIKAIAEDLEF